MRTKVVCCAASAALLLAAWRSPAGGAEPPAASAMPAPPPAPAPPDPPAPPAPPVPPEPPVPPAPPEPPAAGPVIVLPPDPPDTGVGTGRRTPIGAYGEAVAFKAGGVTTSELRRFVVFLGHEFRPGIRVYTETEVEHGNAIEMEQAYLELEPSRVVGVRAGLVLVPLGIINALHEPPTFHGVDRPASDQVIIPTTWRELGVGLYGEPVEGLQYQIYLVSGLDAARFSAATGIRGGRGSGKLVSSKDLALTGRLAVTRVLGLEVGAGFHIGTADQGRGALEGVSVGIAEADARWVWRGLELRAQYAAVLVRDAHLVTEHLRTMDLPGGRVTPAVGSRAHGFHAEAAYNLLRFVPDTSHALAPFARYEIVNTRAAIPEASGEAAPAAQQALVVGLGYKPHAKVALKAEARLPIDDQTGADVRYGLGIGFMF